MKKVLFFLLFPCFSLELSAQTIEMDATTSNQIAKLNGQDFLENAFLECIYEHTTYDPALDKRMEVFEILQIGKKFSKYWNYGYYRVDSVLNYKDRSNITFGECNEIWSKYAPEERNFLLFDKQKQNIQYFGKVFTDAFLYQEPIPTFEWKRTNETKKICGYNCRKATTDFRGRTWVVWYTEELSVNDGPWKFCGLPGLILQATSADEEHNLQAITVRTRDSRIVFEKHNFFKTTRERFNKSLSDFKWNTGQYISGSPLVPKDMNGNSTVPEYRRTFHNPMEKE